MKKTVFKCYYFSQEKVLPFLDYGGYKIITKTLLSVLGAVGITTTGASAAVTSTVSSSEQQETKVVDANIYQKKLIENFEKEFLLTSETTVQKIVLSSLKLNNEKIEINSNNFDVLKNKELIILLKNEEFGTLVQELYNNKTIILNKTNEFIFVGQAGKFTAGLWIETRWFWFGYCKIHINHELSKKLIDLIATSDALTISVRLIGLMPELTTMVPWLSVDFLFPLPNTFLWKWKQTDGQPLGFDTYGMTNVIHYWID